MAKKISSRSVVVVLGLALLALLGLGLGRTAVAGGETGDGWVATLHQHMANHGSCEHGMQGMHSGMYGGMHHRIGRFIEELDLSEEQRGYLETMRHTLLDGFSAHGEGRAAQRAQLLAAVDNGTLTVAEIEGLIDEHLDAMKAVAYDVAEPLAALLNSLDEEQRAMMVDHIKALHGDDS